jgi:hypothetical protein
LCVVFHAVLQDIQQLHGESSVQSKSARQQDRAIGYSAVTAALKGHVVMMLQEVCGGTR